MNPSLLQIEFIPSEKGCSGVQFFVTEKYDRFRWMSFSRISAWAPWKYTPDLKIFGLHGESVSAFHTLEEVKEAVEILNSIAACLSMLDHAEVIPFWGERYDAPQPSLLG